MESRFKKQWLALSVPGWAGLCWKWINNLSTVDFLRQNGGSFVRWLIDFGRLHDSLYPILGLTWLTLLVLLPRRSHQSNGVYKSDIQPADPALKTPTVPTVRYWRGLLEAVPQSPLIANEDGYVLVRLSRGPNETITHSPIYLSSHLNWGEIQRETCSVPFEENKQPTTALQFELDSTDTTIECDKRVIARHLEWEETNKEVHFRVRAQKPGHYFVDVVFTSDSKELSSLLVGTESVARDAARLKSTGGSATISTKVTLRLDVQTGPMKEIAYEISHEITHEEGLDANQGKRYEPGMEMDW